MIKIFQIGDHCVVDPGAEEEAVSGGGLLVSYASGSITSLLKISGGSLHPITLREMIQVYFFFKIIITITCYIP